MAILARNKKSAEVKFNVYIDPKTDSVYLSSKDEDLNALVNSGFRMKIDKNTLQDQIFRKLMQNLHADKVVEVDPYHDIMPAITTSVLDREAEVNLNATMGDFVDVWDQTTAKEAPVEESPNKIEKLDYSKFSGYQAHTVPIGSNDDSSDKETKSRKTSLGRSEVWNWERDPDLYITGEKGSGKTLLLGHIKKYLEYKNIEVINLDLTNSEDVISTLGYFYRSFRSLTQNESSQKDDSLGINPSHKVRLAPVIFIFDNIDSIFDPSQPDVMSRKGLVIFNLMNNLKSIQGDSVHMVLAGKDYNPIFKIRTELFLARGAGNDHKYYQELINLQRKQNKTFFRFTEMNQAGINTAQMLQRNDNILSRNKYEKIVSSGNVVLYSF